MRRKEAGRRNLAILSENMPQSGDVLEEIKVLKIHFCGKRIDIALYETRSHVP
jgi:hypothetical protein